MNVQTGRQFEKKTQLSTFGTMVCVTVKDAANDITHMNIQVGSQFDRQAQLSMFSIMV